MLLQRIGLLYGRYEQDEEQVQNGLTREKVVIHGIYEPPQDIGSTKSICHISGGSIMKIMLKELLKLQA